MWWRLEPMPKDPIDEAIRRVREITKEIAPWMEEELKEIEKEKEKLKEKESA